MPIQYVEPCLFFFWRGWAHLLLPSPLDSWLRTSFETEHRSYPYWRHHQLLGALERGQQVASRCSRSFLFRIDWFGGVKGSSCCRGGSHATPRDLPRLLACRLSPRRSRGGQGRLGRTLLAPARAGGGARRRPADSKPSQGSRRCGATVETDAHN